MICKIEKKRNISVVPTIKPLMVKLVINIRVIASWKPKELLTLGDAYDLLFLEGWVDLEFLSKRD